MSNISLPIRRGNGGLQGGGSACAFTAGVLYRLLADPTIEFGKVTGTSGGALCGAALAQPINKLGYTAEGREKARTRIVDQWDDIAQPDQTAQIGRNIDSLMRMNPMLRYHLSGQYSQGMASHLRRTTLNPNALQKPSPIELTVNAVDSDGNERLFSGKDLNAQSIMASGALPGYFDAVRIDGKDYWDGALLGGSNPSIAPLLQGNRPDFLMFVMTNPPQHPIWLRSQSEIEPEDVQDTENLILHQSYDEIALLLHRRAKGEDIPPIHIISPPIDTPWTSSDKQKIDRSTISERFTMGVETTDRFLRLHGSTIEKKSSTSLRSLKKQALKHHRHLIAA